MAAEPWIDFGDPKYWMELIDSDLAVARTVLSAKKYFIVGMTCYKAAEKILSCWFVSEHQPFELPKNANLTEFAKELNKYSDLPLETQQLLLALEAFNDVADVPVKKDDFAKTLTYEYCERLYAETRAFFEAVT